MLDAVRNLCNQRFPAPPSLDMFAMQDQSSGAETSMNTMLFAATATNASTSCSTHPFSVERGRTRPHPSQVLKCPRCDSLNTKFCYFNNYNLSQPRHFCKTCRRYWTKGGVLRNVPVGGGCRKSNHNKKAKPRNNSASASHHRNRMPKSASNSTVTVSVSSSESSPVNINNDTTSSSNSSVNISETDRTGHVHVFGSELHEILKPTETGNLTNSNIPPEVPVSRLFSGLASLDYFSQLYPPSFPAASNLSENVNSNSSVSNLLGSSHFVGTTFSDLQCKLRQQKTAAATSPTGLNSDKVQEPSSSAQPLCGYTTNNSLLSHGNFNNSNNIIPLEWQVNENSQFLFEEPYCWGTEPEHWLDQTHFTYPNQDF